MKSLAVNTFAAAQCKMSRDRQPSLSVCCSASLTASRRMFFHSPPAATSTPDFKSASTKARAAATWAAVALVMNTFSCSAFTNSSSCSGEYQTGLP